MPEPEFNFISFIAGLAAMAYNAMGFGQDRESIDLKEAKYLIDTISMLEEKTKGNLTSDEEKALRDILYGLRMNYINLVKKG